jgi:hypothetical protein
MSRIKHEIDLPVAVCERFLLSGTLFIYPEREPRLVMVGGERRSDESLAVGLNRKDYHSFKKLIAKAEQLFQQADNCPNLMPIDKFTCDMTLRFVVGYLKIQDFIIFLELSFDRNLRALFTISLSDNASDQFVELKAGTEDFRRVRKWINDTDSVLEELLVKGMLLESFSTRDE